MAPGRAPGRISFPQSSVTIKTKKLNEALTVENSQLKRKNAAQELELKKLRAVIKEFEGSRRVGGSGGKKRPAMNDAIASRVKDIVASELFRVTKFLSSDDQKHAAGEMVMFQVDWCREQLTGPDGQPLDAALVKVRVENFVLIYGHLLMKGINEQRSTSQSQCKTGWKKLRFKGKGMAPTPLQYLRVVLRKGLTPEEEPDEAQLAMNLMWFEWHWEEMVPKCAGKDFWVQGQRYHGIMSEHGPADNPDFHYVSTPTEALCVLFLENGWKKWEYEVREEEKGRKWDKEDKRWVTKWSDAKVGQKVYGGWSNEGRKRFADLIKKVQKARVSARGKLAERACLVALKIKHNITDKKPKKPKKKAEEKEVEPEVEVGFAELSDDEGLGEETFDDLDFDVEEIPFSDSEEESESEEEDEDEEVEKKGNEDEEGEEKGEAEDGYHF